MRLDQVSKSHVSDSKLLGLLALELGCSGCADDNDHSVSGIVPGTNEMLIEQMKKKVNG